MFYDFSKPQFLVSQPWEGYISVISMIMNFLECSTTFSKLNFWHIHRETVMVIYHTLGFSNFRSYFLEYPLTCRNIFEFHTPKRFGQTATLEGPLVFYWIFQRILWHSQYVKDSTSRMFCAFPKLRISIARQFRQCVTLAGSLLQVCTLIISQCSHPHQCASL